MADTEKTAAAATNPADVAQTEHSADVKTDAKTSTTESAAAANGDQADNKNDRNDRRNNRGRGGFQNRNKNTQRNREFDNLPESDDPVEIRNQVEFYFSTQNLVTDEHLFYELDGPKNRPVSIKHIADFKRMRRFRPYTAIVAALRESKDLVVVDDGEFSGTGKEAVKRKEPLVVPEEEGDKDRKPTTTDLFYRLKNASSNKLETSVYVKNFGEAEEAGQIALEQFFRPYGAVMVRKRRDDRGAWKGSVFVEFDSEDSQKQFLALDPKPKFNENDLTIMGKREYIMMKCAEKGVEPDFESKKREYTGNRHRGGDRDGHRGRGRGRGGRGQRGGRGGFDRSSRRDRSPPRRRRDRSGSRGSVDERDWNNRRDRFQNGKDDRARKEANGIEKDAHGVPVVKDTRTDAEIKKRKADDEAGAAGPKKSKLEIKEDE